MRVVLSRKGFDTKYGGIPSPILEDGRMVSLPIPAGTPESGEDRRRRYNELYYGQNERIVDLMRTLGKDTFESNGQSYKFESDRARAHLDPDLLRIALRSRNLRWKPLFGPTENKFSLLYGRIGIGDLFLFFGWFQKVKHDDDRLVLDPDDCNTNYGGKHRIFGYLQVGRIFEVAKDRLPEWTSSHPHVGVKDKQESKHNIIYAAKSSLTFAQKISGAGVFRYEEKKEKNPTTKLTLTKSSHCMTDWELPFTGIDCWNSPDKPLTKPWRGDCFKCPDIGQELLFENPLVEQWAKKLILAHEIRK
jgi:hypothetical protein